MAKMQNPKTPKLVGKITKIEKKVVVPKAAKQVAAKVAKTTKPISVTKTVKQATVKPKMAAKPNKNIVTVGTLKRVTDSLYDKAGLKMGAGDMRNEINKDKAGAQRLYADAWADINRADRYKGLINKALKKSKKK